MNQSRTHFRRVLFKQILKRIDDQLAESTFILVGHFMCFQWTDRSILADDVINRATTAGCKCRVRTETKSTATGIWVLLTQTIFNQLNTLNKKRK